MPSSASPRSTIATLIGRHHAPTLHMAATSSILLDTSSWAALWHCLATHVVDLIVVSPHSVDHQTHREMIRLLEEYPYTRMVLYATLTPQLAGVVVSLTRHGLEDVVIQGYDDSVDRFRHLFAQRRDRDVIDAFLTNLGPALRDLPPMLRRILEEGVEHPERVPAVQEVARAVKLSESTVYRLLHRAGLGSLRPYFRACRVLRAYGYLREHGQTVATVAASVGYRAPRDLARDIRELLHRHPRALPGAGDLTADMVAYTLCRQLAAGGPDATTPEPEHGLGDRDDPRGDAPGTEERPHA